MNPGCRVQDQLNTNEPAASYIIGRELNLRNYPVDSGSRTHNLPKQLRPMTITTSASTETATAAYIMMHQRKASFQKTKKIKLLNNI